MSGKIPFIKMHGLGNDFVLLDARRDAGLATLSPAVLAHIGDRHRGIGCDQIVILKNPKDEKADVTMVIANSDGSFAETCGNAARCVAQFIAKEKNKKNITIDSNGVVLPAVLLDNGLVMVEMRGGNYEWQKIPLARQCDTMSLPLDDVFKTHGFQPLASPLAINVGNPHCVLLVKNADEVAIEKIGRAIEHHPLFPARTNVEFLSATADKNKFRLRVWERGAGATLACGSGAVAAFLALHRLKKIDGAGAGVTMQMDGGTLQLAFADQTARNAVAMTGPASLVYRGELTAI
ncbi:MAG: diaminopimelate epimerase [Hydrotalea sp.]|nr:diaminopimelate epimerase [Hydrotalea sp.]